MKKLISLILVCMMLATVAACGAPASETSASATESAASTAESAASTAESTSSAPAASSESSEPSLLEKIKANGKLVVGTEAQYSPYEFKDLDANFVGCDMWLAQKIADSLDVTLEVIDMSFDGIIPAVQSGQVDMGIAAFTWTAERAEVIDFSSIYEESPQAMIVKAGNEDVYVTKESLAGLKVGAQKGTVQSLLIQKALPDSELFELDKYPELALEVAQGNIAALVVDSAVGLGLVNSNPELAVGKFEFSKEDANFGKAIVMPKGNEDLVAEVNKVVEAAVADGSYAQAYEEAQALAATLGM